MVEVWLTKVEKDDPLIQEKLRQLYAERKNTNYTVVVYHSGNQDLYQNTLNLLAINRMRTKQHEIPQKKAHRYEAAR